MAEQIDWDNLSKLHISTLRKIAQENSIEFAPKSKKAELIAQLSAFHSSQTTPKATVNTTPDTTQQTAEEQPIATQQRLSRSPSPIPTFINLPSPSQISNPSPSSHAVDIKSNSPQQSSPMSKSTPRVQMHSPSEQLNQSSHLYQIKYNIAFWVILVILFICAFLYIFFHGRQIMSRNAH